jgi:hypothetical protein
VKDKQRMLCRPPRERVCCREFSKLGQSKGTRLQEEQSPPRRLDLQQNNKHHFINIYNMHSVTDVASSLSLYGGIVSK